MSSRFDIFLGAVFLLTGMGYLYRPDLVSRVNAFFRNSLFNDAHLKLERKKWGVFFLLLAFLLLYVGWQGGEAVN
jgi:multisubunit Na+/H+ antiporter MnhG subunit